MIVVEYEEVELDHCVKCGGVWFDRDELDYLLAGAGLRTDVLALSVASRGDAPPRGETKRRCPRCGKAMKKLLVGGGDPLMLDSCARHGGYWFDGGELERTVRASLPAGEWEKVGAFLCSLFAKPAAGG
jgi:Zn-finger nucleic acid-binding protein